MKIIYTDVLVIGGGLAGLRMAVAAKRRGHDSIVLSLVPPKRSHSKAAQGGMQASLANVIKGAGDNEDVHFADTVRGSDWGADQDVVRMFVNTSPKAVRELAAWGVPWSRITPGDRQVIINGEKVTITERKEAAGLIAQRDFGGTKKWRTCYVSDGTGHAMLNAVSDRIIAEKVPVVDRIEALSLIHDGKRCYGAVCRDLCTGELLAYVSKATAIATGGAGKLFRVTTNAQICEGTGHALALETGVATCGNMEAVQFHPTGIFPAGILVTEGCRGDGGLLRDVDGYRFMPDVEPEKKELASRDVVSRRMEERIAQGKGVKGRFGEHIWLDITLLGEHHIKHNLREVYEICHYFLGVDPTKEWIPVRPAQHYTMGGVRTNHTGESRQLKGLFAAGEAACWDMHGFNRLGGNSVAETVVAGMIVGEFIADFCDKAENGIDIPTSIVYDAVAKVQSELDGFLTNSGPEDMTVGMSKTMGMVKSVAVFVIHILIPFFCHFLLHYTLFPPVSQPRLGDIFAKINVLTSPVFAVIIKKKLKEIPAMHHHDHDHDHHHHHHDHDHEHHHHHDHDHHHHDHGCEGGCGSCGTPCQHSPMEELMALMKYMVGHNAAHAKELADLAAQLEKIGSHTAYEQVMAAVSDFEKGNMRLSVVLSSLNV